MADKSTKGIRVFVYGTLKAGHGNSGALTGAEFLGRCFLEGPYRMLNLNWYPGVVRDDSVVNGKVFGEVYLVDADILNTLDCIEGHPSYYERFKVDTPWKKAWVYMLPEEYLTEGFMTVENGMWEPSAEEAEWSLGLLA